MSKLRRFWELVSRFRYIVALIVFVVVVGFVDTNSYYHRYQLRCEINDLRAEIGKYAAQYERDTRSLKQLEDDPQAMEKLARERYFMKKPNEDVFIIEEE